MTKIDVNQMEYKALVQLMADAKVPVPLGYVLGSFMGKIEAALRQDQQNKLKEQFTEKDKVDEKSKSNTKK